MARSTARPMPSRREEAPENGQDKIKPVAYPVMTESLAKIRGSLVDMEEFLGGIGKTAQARPSN